MDKICLKNKVKQVKKEPGRGKGDLLAITFGATQRTFSPRAEGLPRYFS
jgi:hypothetical protein